MFITYNIKQILNDPLDLKFILFGLMKITKWMLQLQTQWLIAREIKTPNYLALENNLYKDKRELDNKKF